MEYEKYRYDAAIEANNREPLPSDYHDQSAHDVFGNEQNHQVLNANL